MDGASFLGKFKERLQQRKEARQGEGRKFPLMNKMFANGLGGNVPGHGSNSVLNSLNKGFGLFNPNSNGTGSARPNFGENAQNAIGNIMAGQQMGMQMGFNPYKTMPQQNAGMPPADPMNGDGSQDVANAQAMGLDMSGVSMGVKPKKKAKAEAKAYAAKKGIRGKARKEMIKEAKKSQSFDPSTNTQSKATEEADKAVDFGGASMNGGPGDGRKKPTANIMKSDATSYMDNRADIDQMKGEYASLKRRPASVDYPNMSKSDQADVDFARMNREFRAKTMYDNSYYNEDYRHKRASEMGWDMTSTPGPLNKNYGKTYKLPTEETKIKPAKPQSETKMLKSVKGIEPKKKLMATKTVAKIKKQPLEKMTPRPAKKLSTKKSGASMNGDNGYTYTTTDSKGYAKQKRKEDRKKKVSVSKSKTKKEYKGRESEWLPMSAYKTKRKKVKTKRADRMTKRGWKKDIYM